MNNQQRQLPSIIDLQRKRRAAAAEDLLFKRQRLEAGLFLNATAAATVAPPAPTTTTTAPPTASTVDLLSRIHELSRFQQDGHRKLPSIPTTTAPATSQLLSSATTAAAAANNLAVAAAQQKILRLEAEQQRTRDQLVRELQVQQLLQQQQQQHDQQQLQEAAAAAASTAVTSSSSLLLGHQQQQHHALATSDAAAMAASRRLLVDLTVNPGAAASTRNDPLHRNVMNQQMSLIKSLHGPALSASMLRNSNNTATNGSNNNNNNNNMSYLSSFLAAQSQQQQQVPPTRQHPLAPLSSSSAGRPPLTSLLALPSLRRQLHGASTVAAATSPPTALAVPSKPIKNLQDDCILTIPSDEASLSPYQCLIRKQIEFFQATQEDVEDGSKGRNQPIQLGQVGIRCRYCTGRSLTQRARGSMYFPSVREGIYQSAQHLAKGHLQAHCPLVPKTVREELLRKSRIKPLSKLGGKNYWADAAQAKGIGEKEGRLVYEG